MGAAALVLDHPGFAAAPRWQYAADAAAALGTLPEPGAEPAILCNQPEIPGLSAAGNRPRSHDFLALPTTSAHKALERLPLGPDTLRATSPVLLGLGTARLRGPPTHQSV